MTKKEKRDLAQKVYDYQMHTALVKTNEKEAAALKAEIAGIVQPYADQFVGGEWVVLSPEGARVGTIKEVANRPKLVKADTDLELTDVEKQKLMGKLPTRYLSTTFNVKLMRDEIDAKELAVVLAKQGIEIIQDTRFDIKP